jgi:uncharacterized integral membrane protein (TIGR00698 family)
LLLVTAITAIAYFSSNAIGFISPLTIGLLMALILSNLTNLPTRLDLGAQFASKTLMRIGIVLLGLRISFEQISKIGLPGLVLVLIIVVTTFFGAIALGKVLNVSKNTSILIGAGFAICGNSAIAAVSPAINAKREETAYAVGLVTAFGTISIAVLPILAQLLGLTNEQAGAWSGAAVHDVGQVIAAAEVIGGSALTVAIIIKLTRMLMLVPMLIGLSLRFPSTDKPGVRTAVPGFIVFFTIVVSLNSFLTIPVGIQDAGKTISTLLLTAGIAGMGLGVKWRDLKNIGGKPLLLAILAWIIIGFGSLMLIKLLNVA